jgi:DNA-binding LacI/PurR family transcriptional regulator
VDHLRKHQDIPEIPRSQRYSTRPALSKLIPESINADQRKLKKKLMEAVEKYGYHQSQLARHLAVHRSTISRWLREYENATKET